MLQKAIRVFLIITVEDEDSQSKLEVQGQGCMHQQSLFLMFNSLFRFGQNEDAAPYVLSVLFSN